MARREWAEKVIEKAQRLKEPGDMSWRLPDYLVVRLLKAEHARSVRIVKAEIKRVELDQHTYTAGFKMTLLKELQSLLSKFERGRGGKG